MQTFKLFVSSPSDVMVERRRVENVVSRLNGEFAGVANLQAIRWETEFYQAYSTFQDQIPRSTDCDLVIGILRWRLGTELPPDFREKLPDDQPFPSGTAYEILTAITKRQQGGKLPDIYVFRFAGSSPSVPVDDPKRNRIESEWEALKAFFQRWFLTDRGHFKAAFNPYSSEDDFEEQLEKLLRKWVADKVTGGRVMLWPIEVKGSPFCGLAAFGNKHAPVFFGRSHDTARAIDLLREAGGRGSPYLLLVGASGSGKSSLARAGLVPRLATPGVIAEVDAWRVAVMRPGDSPQGPCAALAAALMQDAAGVPPEEEGREPALPEIAEGDSQTPAELAPVLRHADAAAIKPIVNALARVGASEQQRERFSREVRCDLILLIDQFEELFASSVSEAESDAFVALLAALVATGRVWVMATLRADFYARMLVQPTLKKLKELGATYDLAPPGPVELAEIVRGPAAAAGLVFDTDPATGERLDARLLRDADRPDMLPLVQLALSRLYEGRETVDGEIRLPLKVYESLGGLKGIVNEAGEKALASLGDVEKARLPRVLRQLAIPAQDRDGTGAGALTIRAVPLSQAAPDEPSRKLVDALVTARLLMASGIEAEAQVRLAHQRVLEDWARARTIVAESADFYRVRADLEEGRRKWQAGKQRAELLLPRGLPLAEAENIVVKYGDELVPADLAYVQLSRRRAHRAQIVAWSVAAVFFLVAVGAGITAKVAFDLRAAAVAAKAVAEDQRAKTVMEQHRIVVDLANQNIGNGDVATGMLHAINVLDDSGSDPEVQLDAEGALFDGIQKLREKTFIYTNITTSRAIFSPDHQRVATASDNNTATIWNANTGQPINILLGHTAAVNAIAFNSDASLLLTGSDDKSAMLWDTASGKWLLRFTQVGPVTDVAFSGDSQRVMVRSGDEVRLWDAKSGKFLISIEPPSGAGIQSVALSPDGRLIATGLSDDTAILWDAYAGKSKAVLKGHTDWVTGVAFSPDGKRLATSSWDHTARVWDTASGANLAVLQGHQGRVVSAAFSADERRLLTASNDRTARLWDIASAKTLRTFAGQDSLLEGAALSPDGRISVTASDDRTARIWDNDTGQLIGILAGSQSRVDAAAFSADGSLILTSSTDGTARIWRLQPDSGSMSYTKHQNELMISGFSPDGRLAVTSSWDETARIWEVSSGATRQVLHGHTAEVVSAQFSSDGRSVVTASWDGTARIWDAATGKLLRTLQAHDTGAGSYPNRVNSAAFSPDGKYIVTASNDDTARIWETASGKPVKSFTASAEVRHAVFSPDGRYVAAGSQDKLARIWEVDTGRLVATFTGHTGAVESVAFSADGQLLLTGSVDWTARVWNVASGQQIALLGGPNGHTQEVFSAAFNPDGSRVLTTSADTTARIWALLPAKDGALEAKMLAVLSGHTDVVYSGAFSPDGRQVLTASWDNTARIWKVYRSTMDLLDSAKKAVPRCLSADQVKGAYMIEENANDIMARDSPWCIEMQKGWYDTQYSKNWLRSQRESNFKDCFYGNESQSIIAGCGGILAGTNESWTRVSEALLRRAKAYLDGNDIARAASDLDASLVQLKQGFADGNGPVLQNGDSRVWPSDLSKSLENLSSVSWYSLFSREFQNSLDATDLALKLQPGDIVVIGNRAHALMLLGRTDEARTIYLGHRGEQINGKTWEEQTLADFADLQKAGLTNPLMDEIEKTFAAKK